MWYTREIMIKNPYTKADFTWVSWTPKKMKEFANLVLTHKKNVYAEIKKIPKESRTYENTVYALERSEGVYADVIRQISLLGELSPKADVRTASHEIMIAISSELIDIEYDKELYEALVQYQEGNYKKEKKLLGKDDIKLFEEALRDYRRMGFDLPNATQKKLKTLLKKSSKLGENFRKNINDYEDYILCTREELDGLSERLIASFPHDEKTGKYKVTLEYPHVYPFLSFAHNRAKREELANKNLKKGGKKNLAILSELVELRAEIAHILGYKHHADFRTENRMAKNGETVEKFQNAILEKLVDPAKNNREELKAYAKTLGIKKMEYYDNAYVATSLKKKLFDLDPEEVRTYFPLDIVMYEMFSLFGTTFGLHFEQVEMSLWHKEVRMYKVSNIDGTLVGYLAFDLFPREGKYGHACCMDTVVTRETGWKSDTFVTPFTTIVCNSPRPQGKGKSATPSLLSVGEIETLFHEFGHSLHMTLSLARHESQGGANVAWDFVETPSQIMENWVWQDTVLEKLSKHYKTGERIPGDVRKKIIASKFFQNGSAYMRQVVMGKLDYDLHVGKVKDAAKTYRTLVKKYEGVELPEKDMLFPAGFGHLVGYDAGYYSYLWALVYACDAFSEFEKKGITNHEVGMRWRKEVLEKGSSEDEMKLIKNFLGRSPNQKAFLKEVNGK